MPSSNPRATWAPTVRELRLRGHRALAVDLPGHGPVVLVGTSRGGLTLTAPGNAAPELVDRLVHVSAWCCVDATADEYRA